MVTQVRQAADYAKAIAAVVCDTTSSKSQRRLWLEELGLVYCICIVPSTLFLKPVTALFGPDDWRIGDYLDDSSLVDNDALWKGFFNPELIAKGFLHVEYSLDRSEDKPFRSSVGTLTLDRDFWTAFDELEQYWIAKDEYAPLLTDTQTAYFERRYRRIGLHRLFPQYRGSPEVYCIAIDKLRDATLMRRPSGRHVYLRSCKTGTSSPGVIAFFFTKALGDAHRLFLRIALDALFSTFQAIDNVEYKQRALTHHRQAPHRGLTIHELRTTLATIGNRLHTMRLGATTIDPKEVNGALHSHMRALQLLGDLEAYAVSYPVDHATALTISKIMTSWKGQWPLSKCISTHLTIPDAANEDVFALYHSHKELGDAIYNLVEYSARQIASLPDPESVDGSPYVRMRLDAKRSTLNIDVRSYDGLPGHVEDAIRSVPLSAQLPSLKPGGGKGLLSALSAIKYTFGGTVDFENDECLTNWTICIPVTLIHQYSLFNFE